MRAHIHNIERADADWVSVSPLSSTARTSSLRFYFIVIHALSEWMQINEGSLKSVGRPFRSFSRNKSMF